MSRSTNKEWERRKWYLVRSLFDNEPLLSPIPETQEQSLSPTEAALSRPYSPLPDLIIEKEPNRHDEPEEYYQELEKTIKKVYRRLFLKRRSSVEDSSREDIYDFILMHGANMKDKAVDETTQSEHSSIGQRQSSEKRYSREVTNNSDEQATESTHSSSGNRSGTKDSINSSSDERSKSNKSVDSSSIQKAINESTNTSSTNHSEINSNSSIESSTCTDHNEESKLPDVRKSTPTLEESDTSSLNISHHKSIVTTAQIHDTGKQLAETDSHIEPSPLDKVSGDDQLETYFMVTDKPDESNNTVITKVSTNTEESEAEHEQSEEELESLQSSVSRDEIMERACSSSDASSLDEPETMRRRDTINTSVQSASAFNNRRRSSTGIDFELVQSAREMEEAEAADFSLILGASTPKSQEQRYSKRRILSEIFTNHGTKRSKQNLATQTSFSTTDDENDWQEIRTTFFVGTPCIYRLCTCRNHVCR